jgi:serine/threonine protein kinase
MQFPEPVALFCTPISPKENLLNTDDIKPNDLQAHINECFAANHSDCQAELVMRPQAFCSLHRSTFREEENFDVHAIDWLIQVQEQLLKMHELGLNHGDVKPSNMVCFSTTTNGEYRATLIDFEHASVDSTSNIRTLSATHHYSSRRILLITSGTNRESVHQYQYQPCDDMESLFYSAFEILCKHHQLPWHDKKAIIEGITARNELLLHWDSYAGKFSHLAWKFLSQARNVLYRTSQTRLWEAKYVCVCVCPRF